jgi:type VI secretion system protein ImpE
MQSDLDLFRLGHLSDAVEYITQIVRKNQSDLLARSRLVEYLCVASKFDRADKQLDIIASQDSKTLVRVIELRQIVRASMARLEMIKKGRLPEFISEPPEHVKCRLKALVCMHEGNMNECAQWLKKAEDARPSISGHMGDDYFDDLRDLDDFFGGVFEILTTTGRYMWVPIEHVFEARFVASKRPIDSAWREVELSLRDGPSGVVYIPSLYPDENEIIGNDALSIGLETDWLENEFGMTRGRGLKTFLFGEKSFTLHELTEIRFE